MYLPWPTFWNDVPEDQREALAGVLTDLLAHGAILGEDGRDRERYSIFRVHADRIAEYFAPLGLAVWEDPDRPVVQLRPVPGECGLTAVFDKAETLLVLTLWRIYDDIVMNQTVPKVVVTANELFRRLRLYFENIEPPSETQLKTMLGKLSRNRLVRVAANPEQYGESAIEILPTLPRAIPFESPDQWEQQVDLYS